MTASTHEIVRSYRSLYRYGLRAVQYSSPARHILRKEIRHAYQNNTAADFDAGKIENTLNFLRSAAEERGWAHRILKNLIHIWWGAASSAGRR
jgi:hypothetical protein